MKQLITILLIMISSISYSQNFYFEYSKKEFNAIINDIELNSILVEKEFTDSVGVGVLYLKYTLIGYFRNDSLFKMEVIIDNKISETIETYYFDKTGFLIYVIIEENKYGHTLSIFEGKLYGKEKIVFILDGTPTNYKLTEKNELVKQISKDILFYKNYFSKN